jgi:DNA-directed RNA polymerase subunit RPC12/RpoP
MHHSCPHCSDSALLRRKRTRLERLQIWRATMRPYRCSKCRHEQWLDRGVSDDKGGILDDKDILLSLGILLASILALGILAYGLMT